MPTLFVEDACKSYASDGCTVKAADHISFSAAEKESVAIVGPSGSGKSTLLNMMGLILKPDSGKICVNGKDVAGMGDTEKSSLRNQTFGYIVQDYALLDDETVYQNIRIPLLYSKSIKRSEHRRRIREAAESLGIADKLNRRALRLSGGERQRVAIARAIICDQPVILADEPTGSLDAANKDKVMEILFRLCKKQNKILIIVTHDPTVAGQCDRVVEMRNGRIVT